MAGWGARLSGKTKGSTQAPPFIKSDYFPGQVVLAAAMLFLSHAAVAGCGLPDQEPGLKVTEHIELFL